ncbi:MAG: 16S rRNA (uracil(1498)-N(3))-methyltransferase [Saccharofermentanales bacterium]|jgi:16S rRNA (uracil1498-N3)-methyltransferase|nr:16S rRNA (uracil(1498)-N(3))-methyltransferase [Clostridiaceae bacterium]
MPRFFPEDPIDPSLDWLVIRGDSYRHIRDVLRLRAGDSVTVCDGALNDMTCVIDEFLPDDGLVLVIKERQINQREPSYHVTLYQGLAKGDRMDSIMQKAVELGVSRIVPTACRHSVLRLENRDLNKRQIRWQRIATEAAKQCGRGRIPEVCLPLPFSEAVREAASADIALIPWENEQENDLRTVMENIAPKPDPRISILIGPEGGFAADEISAALALNIQPVTLGRRILRTETAGPAVLAMLIYAFRDF